VLGPSDLTPEQIEKSIIEGLENKGWSTVVKELGLIVNTFA